MPRFSPAQMVIAPLLFLLAAAIPPDDANAQGAAGGSIGNDDKAISGSRPERTVRDKPKPNRPAAEPRRAARRESGAGVAKFDGVWSIRATGQSSVCAGYTEDSVITIQGGRITGAQVRSGSISASGASRATGFANGATTVSTGFTSGDRGSGRFSASNGCSGTFVSSRQ